MNSSQAQEQKTFYDKKFKRIATKGMENNIAHFHAQKMIDILGQHTNLKEGSRLLEIGVGKGLLMERMMRHFPQCSFKGIDISEKSINVAKEKGLDVTVADANTISLPEKFHVIYGTAVLHHLEDIPSFLNRISGMLEDDGVILFGGEPVAWEFFYILYHMIRGSWPIEKGLLKITSGKMREYLKVSYQNIKICSHGNVFIYAFYSLGRLWNALRLSQIPCLSDIFIYAQKKDHRRAK